MCFKFILLFLLFAFTAHAQESEVVREWIEKLSVDLPDDLDVSELTEQLIQLNRHKINLNESAENLKELFFVSPLQISNLLIHIKNNGPLLNVVELQAIPGFDTQTIQRLIPFVEVSPPAAFVKFSLKEMRKNGENELLMRYGRIFENQKGYQPLPGSRYLGTPDRALVRYGFRYQKSISASLIFEKDAGEFYKSHNNRKLMDFTSGNIQLSKLGVVEKVILGDFGLQFGQGLTMWSGFSFGKGSDVSSITKNAPGLKPYSSSNEYSFFRGIAANVKVMNGVSITPFISRRNMDASLSLGPTATKTFTTINESGLHRTSSEQLNEGSLPVTVLGGALQYSNIHFTAGLIAYRTLFGHSATTGNSLYQASDFVGSSLMNIGINYSYSFRNLYLFGETAISLPGKFATVDGLLLTLSPTISVAILYRNYDKEYHNYFSQAMGEGSDAANESGLFTAMNVTPNKYWNISVYTDFFKFPWLKYRIDGPSNGNELVATINYTPSKTMGISIRYKSNAKEQNTNDEVPISYLEMVKKESYRLNVKWQYGIFQFQNGFEFDRYKKGPSAVENGFLIYQDAATNFVSKKISGNIRLAFFKTDTYNSRIYAYERDVLYGFSSGMYNGTGLRLYFNMRYQVAKKLTFWMRYLISYYPNESLIGSGLEEIDGKKKQDFKLQMRYQF